MSAGQRISIPQQLLESFSNKVETVPRFPQEALKTECDPMSMLKTMSSSERSTILGLHKTYGDKLKRVVLMGNRNMEGTTIGGHVLALDPNTKLDVHDLSLAREPFQYVMMAHVPDEDYEITNSQVLKKHAALKQTMIEKKFDSKNIVVPSIATHYSDEHCLDQEKWDANYYGPNSFAAVYYTKLPHTNGARQYFVMASANAGPEIAKEIQSIILKEQPTAAEFAYDNRIKWAKDIAYRNTARLLSDAAASVGLRIFEKEDHFAKTRPHHKKPMIAKPDVVVATNTFSAGKFGSSGEDTVAFYNETADGAQGKLSTLILGDPYKNVYEYQGKKVDCKDQTIHNAHYNALPMKTTKLALDKSTEMAELPSSVQTKLMNKISTNSKIAPTQLMQLSYNTREVHNHKEFSRISAAYKLDKHPSCFRVLKPVIYCMNVDKVYADKNNDIEPETFDYEASGDPSCM